MKPVYYNKNKYVNQDGVYGNNLDDDSMYDINLMASTNDCTGLIPTPPTDDEESESYTKLYDIPKPKSENPDEIFKKSRL